MTSSLRRVFGALRIAVGLFVLVSIAIQVGDLVTHDEFKPHEYFAYFTIQTSIAISALLIFSGVLALRRPDDPRWLTTIRMCAVAYAIVTAAVYALLLRGVAPEGYVAVEWPNEVMHVWLPLFVGLDWLFAPGRAVVPWSRVWVAILFPVVWCAFTLVRGAVTGWYPYPFIDPASGGWPSVLAYIVGLAAAIVGLSSLAVALTRRRPATV